VITIDSTRREPPIFFIGTNNLERAPDGKAWLKK